MTVARPRPAQACSRSRGVTPPGRVGVCVSMNVLGLWSFIPIVAFVAASQCRSAGVSRPTVLAPTSIGGLRLRMALLALELEERDGGEWSRSNAKPRSIRQGAVVTFLPCRFHWNCAVALLKTPFNSPLRLIEPPPHRNTGKSPRCTASARGCGRDEDARHPVASTMNWRTTRPC